MSRAYEVRDVQTLLGKLADEGVINPQAIGATGGSYGGGMSLQLGSLKDRVELPNHELIPWESPGGKPMKIAATAPEFPWTDIAQALQPNGSSLDYVANSPYSGMLGDHRFGIEKNNWNATLYGAGLVLGLLRAGTADPEANLTDWHNFNITGGPYDGKPLAIQQEEQLPYHSPYYTNLSEPPAPSADGERLERRPVPGRRNGQATTTRSARAYPNQAMKLFYLDLGHNPRSATTRLHDRRGQVPGRPERVVRLLPQRRRRRTGRIARWRDGDHELLPADRGRLGDRIQSRRTGRASHRARSGSNSAAEQTIQAPGTAPATAFTSGHDLHDAGRRRQRLGGDVQARRGAGERASRSPAHRR